MLSLLHCSIHNVNDATSSGLHLMDRYARIYTGVLIYAMSIAGWQCQLSKTLIRVYGCTTETQVATYCFKLCWLGLTSLTYLPTYLLGCPSRLHLLSRPHLYNFTSAVTDMCLTLSTMHWIQCQAPPYSTTDRWFTSTLCSEMPFEALLYWLIWNEGLDTGNGARVAED